jgi:hypothetical protein
VILVLILVELLLGLVLLSVVAVTVVQGLLSSRIMQLPSIALILVAASKTLVAGGMCNGAQGSRDLYRDEEV